MSDMFYRSFEERHRGSVELIKSRLEVYLPFIQPLKKIYKNPKGIDLGCGRGEWIELLQENHFDILGVDLNDGMIQRCIQRNLNVVKEDAIHYLKKLESESLEIISAFHFVEHIEFESLRLLINEALRILKPGGLLILETPNSENLMVGTSSFYLDPTHQRPIPELLLSFIAEHTGFKRTKSLFLQEPKDSIDNIGVYSILTRVSPDYAIVSQKNASSKILSQFDDVFNKNYGVHLLELAEKYDNQIKSSLHNLIDKSTSLECIVEKLDKRYENQISTLQSDINNLQSDLNKLHAVNKKQEDKNNSEISSFFIEQKKVLYYINDIIDQHAKKIEENSRKILEFSSTKDSFWINQPKTFTPELEHGNKNFEQNSNNVNAAYLQQTIHLLEKQLTQEQTETLHLRNNLHFLHESNAQLQQKIQQLHSSRSWRYTFICRKIAHIYRSTIKKLLKNTIHFIPLRIFNKKNSIIHSIDPKHSITPCEAKVVYGHTHDELSLRSTRIYLNLIKYFNNKGKNINKVDFSNNKL